MAQQRPKSTHLIYTGQNSPGFKNFDVAKDVQSLSRVYTVHGLQAEAFLSVGAIQSWSQVGEV